MGESLRAPFVPLPRRPRLTWPNGARLAVWVVPNIEYFDPSSLVGAGLATKPAEAPDVPNATWREYGLRVGIWRTLDMMHRLRIPGTVALNADVCVHAPEVVEACVALGWEFMGHGRTNSSTLAGLSHKDEREVIGSTLDTIERHTGTRPKGWLGPALAETTATLEILSENGVQYVGDWVNDEQPYPLTVKGGTIVAMPYTLEVNDIAIYLGRGFTGPDYLQLLLDQFEVLHEESAATAKVMCVALHPFITGVPFRAKYLELALSRMREHADVWFATGSEILQAYQLATK